MTLVLESVTHRFGPQAALDGVTLHVREGDLYGFLGHNGAGKTTSMRIALGLIRPQRGRVIVDGFDAARYPLEARARMGGLIETPGFYRRLDGRSNLLLLARLQGMSPRRSREEVDRLLEVVGLTGVGPKHVGSYSQGMRQRLGIAQAILGNPKIVLLDEPMNGLDPEGIGEIRSLLVRLRDEEGMTVLLSSHQIREIADVCNRVAVLRQGKVLVEEPTSELLEDSQQRHRLRTSDDTKTARLLESLSVAREDLPGGGFLVALDGVGPERLSRSIVESGVDLVELSPRTPSLEEVYLHFARNGSGGEDSAGRTGATEIGSAANASAAHTSVANGSPSTDVAAPARKIAPPLPILRVLRHEFARWTAFMSVPVMTATPALLALAAIVRRKSAAVDQASQVESEALASTTGVTAFEGVAVGLEAGLPLLIAILAGLGSQSIAGGLQRGTLRNMLLRPVTRIELAVGKGMSLVGVAVIGYAILAAVSVMTSALVFDFTDVAEILPNGEPFPLIEASELWPQLQRVLLAPILPLVAFASIGFFAGGIARNGTAALGLALGGVVFLDLTRVLGREYRFEGFMPSAHLPSVLGDVSFVRYYHEAVQGVSNADWRYAEQAILTPACWILIPFLIATFVLGRRPIH